MPKKKKTRYPKSDKKDGAPFSRLEVYKELQAINERVEKVYSDTCSCAKCIYFPVE